MALIHGLPISEKPDSNMKYDVFNGGIELAICETMNDQRAVVESFYEMDMTEIGFKKERAVLESANSNIEALEEGFGADIKNKAGNAWSRITAMLENLRKRVMAILDNMIANFNEITQANRRFKEKYGAQLRGEKVEVEGYNYTLNKYFASGDSIHSIIKGDLGVDFNFSTIMNSTAEEASDIVARIRAKISKTKDESIARYRGRLCGTGKAVNPSEYSKDLFASFRDDKNEPSKITVTGDDVIRLLGDTEKVMEKCRANKKTIDSTYSFAIKSAQDAARMADKSVAGASVMALANEYVAVISAYQTAELQSLNAYKTAAIDAISFAKKCASKMLHGSYVANGNEKNAPEKGRQINLADQAKKEEKVTESVDGVLSNVLEAFGEEKVKVKSGRSTFKIPKATVESKAKAYAKFDDAKIDRRLRTATKKFNEYKTQYHINNVTLTFASGAFIANLALAASALKKNKDIKNKVYDGNTQNMDEIKREVRMDAMRVPMNKHNAKYSGAIGAGGLGLTAATHAIDKSNLIKLLVEVEALKMAKKMKASGSDTLPVKEAFSESCDEYTITTESFAEEAEDITDILSESVIYDENEDIVEEGCKKSVKECDCDEEPDFTKDSSEERVNQSEEKPVDPALESINKINCILESLIGALTESNCEDKECKCDKDEEVTAEEQVEPVSESVIEEATLSTDERNDLKDSEFGVPEERKFPLTDKEHVLSAIKFFNDVNPKHEEELANKINEKIKELGMTDVGVGEDNKFSKYYNQEKPVKESVDDSLLSGFFE